MPDLASGLSVALISIPEDMAYALAAGVEWLKQYAEKILTRMALPSGDSPACKSMLDWARLIEPKL